jgi:hypothetical protein
MKEFLFSPVPDLLQLGDIPKVTRCLAIMAKMVSMEFFYKLITVIIIFRQMLKSLRMCLWTYPRQSRVGMRIGIKTIAFKHVNYLYVINNEFTFDLEIRS